MSRKKKLLSKLLSKPKDFKWNELKTLLDEFDIEYEVDTNLVRGLDYYNKNSI